MNNRTLLVKVEHPADEIGSIFVEIKLPESLQQEDLAIVTVRDGLKFSVTDITDKGKK